ILLKPKRNKGFHLAQGVGTALANIGVLMKPPMPTYLHHPLAKEISLAIAIKLLVIAAIFYAFFDGLALHPDAVAVAERLANPYLPAHTSLSSPGSSHAD